MNRRLVITSVALGAAALAAAAYFLLRDDDAATRAASNDPTPVAGDGSATGRALPPDRAQPRRPSRSAGPGEAADVYYLEDGTQVRDHRSGDEREPPIWPGDVPHPSRSPVSPQVTSSVMALVRPLVLRCFKSLPDAAFSEDAIVVTRTVVSIDDTGKLTVLELGPQSRGVDATDAAAAEAAHQCVRDGAVGLTAQVENAAVESTVLVFPIRPKLYRR